MLLLGMWNFVAPIPGPLAPTGETWVESLAPGFWPSAWEPADRRSAHLLSLLVLPNSTTLPGTQAAGPAVSRSSFCDSNQRGIGSLFPTRNVAEFTLESDSKNFMWNRTNARGKKKSLFKVGKWKWQLLKMSSEVRLERGDLPSGFAFSFRTQASWITLKILVLKGTSFCFFITFLVLSNLPRSWSYFLAFLMCLWKFQA